MTSDAPAPETAQDRVRREGTGRTEAFSDGVLAIAITLLVLDLHTGDHTGTVGHDLLAHGASYVAYVSSFLYIGVLWVNHHALFARIAAVDTGLLWCNLVLLLAASVLPFPTAQLAFAMQSGTHGDRVAAFVLYAVVAAGTSASWLLTFTYLHRRPALHAPDVPESFFREERRRALAGIVAAAVPVVVALASPGTALVLLLATPVFYALTAEGLVRSRS